jgi:epoxide hydrolase 4
MNFYRAMPAPPPKWRVNRNARCRPGGRESSHPAHHDPVPTLVVWGMQDHALLPSLLEGLDEFVPDLTIHRIEDGTHWIAHDTPTKSMRPSANTWIRGSSRACSGAAIQ